MMQVALDSQVYSYLNDGWAVDGPSRSDPLYKEKLALARMIFYFDNTLGKRDSSSCP